MSEDEIISEKAEETATKEEEEVEEEEEYSEELSIQDLEFFVEITELWEKMLRGEASISELTKLERKKVKVKARRKRRK
ncbi:MAG: hypothetical protein J7J78_02175 [Thermoprotei archaeon]|nr:hypothetical protein [Thermoprotei archaeon]